MSNRIGEIQTVDRDRVPEIAFAPEATNEDEF
jgi:hypothetical protein